MKKIFTLLTAVLLSAGMVVQAQLRDAVNDSQESETIPQKANLLKGRNNAPQVVYTIHWDWTGDTYFNVNGYQSMGPLSGYNVYKYQWNANLKFYFSWSTGTAGSWTCPANNTAYVMPPKGDYTIQQNIGDKKIANYNSKWTGSWTNSIYIDQSTEYWWDGTLRIEEGADGPYIHNATSSAVRTTPDGNGCYSYNFSVGSPATYASSISAVSNNNTMGTASISYVSGYVYSRTTEYKNGSTYRLTATPNSGYRFVRWEKNGSQISTDAITDVVIDGNATYTAYFESNAAPQYTITVQTATPDYCTVSGGGTYYAGTEVTISSTSKNPHLYIFDQFMLEGEDEDLGEPSFNITVTGDATYTAHYRLANPGTISATAAHGTVSGTGYYAGGTEVSLGVTADDGYIFSQWSDGNTDNPRTVYVDGNKNYTAQFVQGVGINAENSVLYVWDSDGETPLESGGGSFFDFVCADGDYTVQIESASTAFSTATFSGSQLEQTANYTYVMYNGNKIALDYSQSTITFTANSEQYNKRKFYDVNATLVATNGTRYVITAKAIRAMNWDSDSDYRDDFPQNDYNFAAPTYATSIWEYKNSSWSYSANSKWLTANVTISNYIYRIRLAFNVSTDYIPTGVYTLATGNGSLLSNYATPAYSYNTSAGWASEIDGSHVFQYGTGYDDNSYWWFLETGTISVVNTNGVYYVEVDALNSRGLPVRFTMGTPPSNNHTVTITAPTNGTITVLDGETPISNGDEVEEGTTLTISAAGNTGYHLTALTVNGNAFTSGETYDLDDDITIAATFAANTHNVSWVTDGNALTGTYTNGTTAYGTTIVAPATPTKTATAQYTYTFNGWTPEVAATMPDNDVTYTATWTETPVNYTLTWTTDGDELTGEYTHGTVAYGTAIAVPNTPTKTGYTFNGWDSEPAATMPAANTTYTAQWNANAYTVTFNKNGGTGDDMTAQDFTYGTAKNLTVNAYTAPENKHFMGWATTAEGDVAYADGAEVSNLTATKDGSVELFAKWAYNTYTVVFNKNNESAIGSMAAQAFTYGTAQNLTANGFILSGYDFAGWALTENGKIVYTNQAEVNNLTSEHEGTVTLYAQWRERFVLEDNHTSLEDDWYNTYNTKKAENKALNVTYQRTFTKDRWATFSLPFGYSYRVETNRTFYGQIYQLVSAKYEKRDDGNVYLTLNCMPATTGIVANKPYIIIPNETIVNPVFENVKLQPIAENPYEVSDMGGTGTVEFRNTTYRQRIDNNLDKRVIFLQNNLLRYPNGQVNMNAFRGYFYLNYETLLHAPVRVRLVNEEGEEIETLPETAEETSVETRKYFENGILVIERAGIKYDAQGHKLN